MNFQMFKLVLKKAEEPEIKLPTSAGLWKKQEFQKNIYFCFIDYAKTFDCVDHHKPDNSERWCCESAALNMPANLENSAVATGLEKVSFHSNSKELQCQRMLKPPLHSSHMLVK